MGSDYGVKATFDDSEIVAAFKRIDNNINRMAQLADTNFNRVRNSGKRSALEVQKAFETVQKSGKFSVKQLDDATLQLNKAVALLKQSGRFDLTELGNSAQLSGVQIGLVSGAVSALTTALINMGAEGIRALAGLASESVGLANRLDTTTAQFVGIFRGNKQAATAALEDIRAESRKLGIDLTELAAAFLPQVKNLDEFERLAKVAAALAKAQPEQGALGARIALQEGQSGDLLSLRRRFEIPEESINRIKQAQKEFGNTQGLIIGLEAELKRLGRDLNTLGGTAQTQFDIVKSQLEEVGAVAGKPILEALKQEAADFSQFLSENRAEILLFAENLGEAAASVIEFVGNLINVKNIDASTLVDFSEKVLSTVTALETFITQLINVINQAEGAKLVLGVLAAPFIELWDVLTRLDEALITGTQLLGIFSASWAGLRAAIDPMVQIVQLLVDTLNKAAQGDFTGAAQAFENAIERMKKGAIDVTGAQDAFTKSILETNQAINQYNKTVNTQDNKQKQLKKTIDETKTAALQQADAILKANSAASSQPTTTTASEKVKEETRNSINLRDSDMVSNFRRKETDKQKADKQTMEEAKKEAERLTDELVALSKKREEAEEKYRQNVIKAEKKTKAKIKELKNDLKREELQLLAKQAEERSKLEQEIAADSIAAEKKYQQQLEDNRADFRISADEAIRNRSVTDFFAAIREKEQADTKAQTDLTRELEDIKANGDSRRAELVKQQAQELAQQKEAAKEKLRALKESLEEELNALKEYHQKELEEIRKQEEEKQTERATAVDESQPPRRRKRKTFISMFSGYFAGGGIIPAGSWGVVGERGPELVYARDNTNVLPHDETKQLMYSQPKNPTAVNNYDNSSVIQLSVPADKLTPGQIVEARRIALSVQREVKK